MKRSITIQGITSYIPEHLIDLIRVGKTYDWDFAWLVAEKLKWLGQPSFVAPGETKARVLTTWKSSLSVAEKYARKSL